jgi:hypothetical protein
VSRPLAGASADVVDARRSYGAARSGDLLRHEVRAVGRARPQLAGLKATLLALADALGPDDYL